MEKASGITWTSKTIRVDADTGEEITKHNAEKNYIKLKTVKHVEINHNKTKGFIEWTILYTKTGKQLGFDGKGFH